MLNPIKLAHATAIVSVVCQIILIVASKISPDAVYFYFNSMMPGYNLGAIAWGEIDYVFSLLGVILVAISAWIFVYATVWTYNRLGSCCSASK